MAAGGTAVVAPVASAAVVPGCTAANLRIVPGRVDAATSHQYPTFRVTNTGDHTCRLYGTPTFHFRNGAGKPIGYPSKPNGETAHVVRLRPGKHTKITLGYVVTQVTLARQCHARQASSVDFTLAYRSHVYDRSLKAKVCTTRMYRPTAAPVGS
jgi:hypothetical protein